MLPNKNESEKSRRQSELLPGGFFGHPVMERSYSLDMVGCFHALHSVPETIQYRPLGTGWAGYTVGNRPIDSLLRKEIAGCLDPAHALGTSGQ